ncbi:MAG: hypothetical protein DRJ41_01360 [Thermoprotei archaeon]|nr:MAG: hypothetical protein DRJ41_01360 [Thermoprotei archaeon]
MKDIHPHDFSSFLNEREIAIRSSMHCAHPMRRRLRLERITRANF